MKGYAELLIRASRVKKPYRLKCRLKIEPAPSPVRDYDGHLRWRSRLEREKVRIAERFVSDMKAQGWEHRPGDGFRMRGPFPMVVPKTIHRVRALSAKEMMPHVAQGARFLDRGTDGVSIVPKLEASEWWEFEISGVFIREQILTESPDPHEEVH